MVKAYYNSIIIGGLHIIALYSTNKKQPKQLRNTRQQMRGEGGSHKTSEW